MKEGHGDTIKEHIMRYGGTSADTSMIDSSMKLEDKMIIEKILEPLDLDNDHVLSKIPSRASSYFRWNSTRFIRLFLKLSWQKLALYYHTHLLATLFTLLYLLHWFFYTSSRPFHFILSGIIHLSTILLCFSMIVFSRCEPGSIEKEHVTRDFETNVIG